MEIGIVHESSAVLLSMFEENALETEEIGCDEQQTPPATTEPKSLMVEKLSSLFSGHRKPACHTLRSTRNFEGLCLACQQGKAPKPVYEKSWAETPEEAAKHLVVVMVKDGFELVQVAEGETLKGEITVPILDKKGNRVRVVPHRE
ncbi:MAG: hypothetical protein M1817_001424 [Caeruleum heppii]|nr:MAG: hypothetical protein M1817_001424 [Caeruleum heppii]